MLSTFPFFFDGFSAKSLLSSSLNVNLIGLFAFVPAIALMLASPPPTVADSFPPFADDVNRTKLLFRLKVGRIICSKSARSAPSSPSPHPITDTVYPSSPEYGDENHQKFSPSMRLLFFNSVLTLSASSQVKRPSLEAVSCSFETKVLFVPLCISDSF